MDVDAILEDQGLVIDAQRHEHIPLAIGRCRINPCLYGLLRQVHGPWVQVLAARPVHEHRLRCHPVNPVAVGVHVIRVRLVVLRCPLFGVALLGFAPDAVRRGVLAHPKPALGLAQVLDLVRLAVAVVIESVAHLDKRRLVTHANQDVARVRAS